MSGAYPDVSIVKVKGDYPAFPFDPDERFPEYKGAMRGTTPNAVYRAVRESFRLLGFDRENFGTSHWNPLGHLIKPGNAVFIKPNLVAHEYGRKVEGKSGDLFSVITHPSVVRAVADYAALALKGEGSILIGDNPSIDADFSKIMAETRLDQLVQDYPKTFGVPCKVVDLRKQWCDHLKNYGYRTKMASLPGDPGGASVVNLGKRSYFYGMNPLLFRGVFTNRWDTIKHHHGQIHEYEISNSIYRSDVYISIPKLKTHHKVGATLNIKGLVGICANKNYLIHWRIGFPSWGGDEFPESRNPLDHARLFLKHLILSLIPDQVHAPFAKVLKGSWLDKMFQVSRYRGAWQGNDSCWRMAADLYHVLRTRPRQYLSVIDGITAGEENGPFMPQAKKAGVLLTGEDLIKTDCAAVRLMDFHLEPVRYLSRLLKDHQILLDDTQVVSEDFDVSGFFSKSHAGYLRFQPPANWESIRLTEL